MNTYHYVAKDKNGHTVSGVLDAASESEVGDALHKKDLIIVSIEAAKGKASLPAKKKKVKLDDLIAFIRQLATLVDSGVTLVHALNIMTEQVENKTLKGITVAMRQDIEEGLSFSETLAKYPLVFSELFMNMVRAGEVSGSLPEVLNRLAAYMEKSAALSRKIRSSLVYPAVVIIMSIIITAVLLLKVVPIFKGIFDILGGKLPFPTQVLIMISDTLRHYFLFSAVVLAAFFFLLKKFINTAKGRYIFDMKKLTMPVLGPLFSKLAIAKFTRTFATLVKSGVAILSTLEIVAKTAGNKVVEEALQQCARSVRTGEPISQPLSKNKVFPPLVCSMISVGEKTGQLEKMLNKIADFYEEQVDVAASALTSMIEPLVIAFLGIVIGGIVISLFMPIFKITELISK